MENNNVDEQGMKSVVDEQEFESEDDEEEMDSDFDEQDDDEESEMEIKVGEQQQPLISSLLLKQYLQATNWNVEDAVRLFYSQDVRGGLWGFAEMGTVSVEGPVITQDDNRASQDSLSLKLMYQGPFHEAKQVAETQNRWLIVNVQSKKEFDSYALNLHTWAHGADLAPFMDAGPKHPTEKQESAALVAPASIGTYEWVIGEPVTSSSKKLTYPDLPEEPKVDKTLLCRIEFRLPDGRRLQRNFLRTDPLQLLWSFCSSQLDEAESRPFQLTQAIPGASKFLDYEGKQTFEESGLANSMISVTWD
ncbi:hypothetical protein MKX01_031199 [Papaver californicum]|nr:hypothetical protein MKX01_031199 [Papaver californicum]